MVLPSALGLNTSIVSILLLNSNIECESVHPCTFAVHATSVLPLQKPTVSPYHCGTFCTCDRPISTSRRKLSATPDSSSTRVGVMLSSKLPPREDIAHQRIRPSGQQKPALHCFALVTPSWNRFW